MAKDDGYDTLQMSHDAAEFAQSRFGAHYLKRLHNLHDTHMNAAKKLDYTDSYRANRASKAAAVESEIEFFKIAQTIQKTPSLLERLKLKLRKEAEDQDV